LTIRMVGLGRAARSAGKQKVRQPLSKALLRLRRPQERALLAPFAEQIAEELNVKTVDYLSDDAGVARYTLRPNLPALGPRLGPDMPKLTAALKALDAGEAVAQLRRGERLTLTVGNREVTLGMDDVQPQATALEGFSVAEEHGYLVALATTLTDELREEGLAREFVHRIQTMRKSAGFEVSDRITLAYEAGPRLTAMLERWDGFVASETLAVSVRQGETTGSGHLEYLEVDGEEAKVELVRA